jgi:hypothetical protein
MHVEYYQVRRDSDALFLGDFDYFAAFIASAMRAGPMGQFRFVTIGTLGAAGNRQRIVRAAGRGPALGVSSFWIRHLKFL